MHNTPSVLFPAMLNQADALLILFLPMDVFFFFLKKERLKDFIGPGHPRNTYETIEFMMSTSAFIAFMSAKENINHFPSSTSWLPLTWAPGPLKTFHIERIALARSQGASLSGKFSQP